MQRVTSSKNWQALEQAWVLGEVRTTESSETDLAGHSAPEQDQTLLQQSSEVASVHPFSSPCSQCGWAAPPLSQGS